MASSGHFPGAPFNTDPITTMATSSTEPVTSASGASIVQDAPSSQRAPSSVASQAAPSSVDARTTAAAEEPRAASSASNAQGADAAPGSVNPATTSTVTTTTTATTSSSSTAATTSTTTTTTTTATGKTSPQIPIETIFHGAMKNCNNCLFMIRKLRSKQDHVTKMFVNNSINSNRNFYDALQDYKDFTVMMREVMIMYEKLDSISRRLPKVLPAIPNINNMRTLYTQEHTMCHTNINNLLEKMIDSGNWNEGNWQIFHYLSELLRVHGSRKVNRFPEKQQLPSASFHSFATNGHRAFDSAYEGMKKEIVNKSLGIYPKTLHRTASSLIIEFLFGCGGSKILTDEDVVYTMKFLLVERNGQIDYINMVATSEEWEMCNNFGTPVINPFAPSRYEVFRRLTKHANTHLLNCFGSGASRWSTNSIIQFISMFGKFRDVFSTRCRVCRQYLKNYLPPLIFDIRQPQIAAHEACR